MLLKKTMHDQRFRLLEIERHWVELEALEGVARGDRPPYHFQKERKREREAKNIF